MPKTPPGKCRVGDILAYDGAVVFDAEVELAVAVLVQHGADGLQGLLVLAGRLLELDGLAFAAQVHPRCLSFCSLPRWIIPCSLPALSSGGALPVFSQRVRLAPFSFRQKGWAPWARVPHRPARLQPAHRTRLGDRW